MLVDVMFNRPLASWFWSSEKIWAEDLESYIAETLVPRGVRREETTLVLEA